MSTELPDDLRGHFIGLEQQATSLMRDGKYEVAEKIFRTMLETVFKRQQEEKRRLHKGSYFHNIGLSLLLQNKLVDSLRNFLLAYIEDCLNTEVNHENNADSLPASRVLSRAYTVTDQNLSTIKDIVRSLKQHGNIALDPEDVLEDFLHRVRISDDNLFALCARQPQFEELKGALIVTLTPEARRALDETVSRMGNQVLERAVTIAQKRKAAVVTEEDVREAIRQLLGGT